MLPNGCCELRDNDVAVRDYDSDVIQWLQEAVKRKWLTATMLMMLPIGRSECYENDVADHD